MNLKLVSASTLPPCTVDVGLGTTRLNGERVHVEIQVPSVVCFGLPDQIEILADALLSLARRAREEQARIDNARRRGLRRPETGR